MGLNMRIRLEALIGGYWLCLRTRGFRLSADPAEGVKLLLDDVDPEVRDYAVYGRLSGIGGMGDDRDPIMAHGVPDGSSWVEDESEYGPWWATLDDLLSADWTGTDGEDLLTHDFGRWLRGERMTNLAERVGGPMRVRVVVGFS